MRFPLLAKVLAMGAVMLLLVLVMGRIDALVRERHASEGQARANVEESLAGAQTLLGPWLHRRCTEEWEVAAGGPDARERSRMQREHVVDLPARRLAVNGELRGEARHRGLFRVNGWASRVELRAEWPALEALRPTRSQAGSRLQCEPARLLVGVSDVRGLRTVQINLDGEAAAAEPGTGHPRFASGLHALLPAARTDSGTAPLVATVVLDLIGTSRLALVPAATQTTWALRSDWPHPSFDGRFLPVEREVGSDGFRARWAVSSLASAAAAGLAGQAELCGAAGPASAARAQEGPRCLDTLGVTLFDPVNVYVLTDRATKYALLFIVLTFVAVALTEVVAGRHVHPVQYLLVGLALAVFYLLLLGLAEHIGFARAYAAASAACALLLVHYGSHMLGGWRAGLAFGGGVAALYGLLWVLLQREQTALVIGALLLFAALAAVMVLTRRIDWYTLFGEMRRPAAGGG